MSFVVRPVRAEKKSSVRIRKIALFGSGLLEALIHLYRRMKIRHEEELVQEHRTRILKRTVMILLSSLLILLLLIGTLRVLVGLKAISLENMIGVVSSSLPSDEHGFTNILLLGVGDNDHDGIDLTDTIMVVSVDPSHSKSTVMLSLPRDLYFLHTENMGKGRINSLYRDYKKELMRSGLKPTEASAKALKELSTEIGMTLKLPIHGVIKLNFSGFTEAIDALGGIDVVIPEDIVDTEYPGPNYTFETFSIGKGQKHLDGATALKYARTRHTTSDFSRSGRQQQIIAAAGDKAKSTGLLTSPSKISTLISIVAKNMETSFTSRELLGLVQMGKSIDHQKIVNMQLSDQNGLYDGLAGPGGFLYAPPREEFDGAAVLLPVSLPEFPITWKQLQKLSSLLFLHREAFVRPPSILITNGGAKEGSARSIGTDMVRYGFNILKTRNFSKGNKTVFDTSWIAINPVLSAPTGDASLTDRKKRAEYSALMFAEMLSIPVSKTPPTEAFEGEQSDILIVLGKDYRYSPLQDLIR